MAQIQMRSVDMGNRGDVGTAPLIALFERDDSIAVPLLSQIRMAGYDVRAARTPVELFDLLGKSFVSLALIDLGAASAGRREFWVALDAHRRGRALQVMTFRYLSPASAYDLEFETSARAIADVEIHSAHELPRIIDGLRQRIPLNGAFPGTGMSLPPGTSIPPIGSALGAPAPFSLPLVPPAQGASPYGMAPLALGAAQFGGAPIGMPGTSPFAPQYPMSYPSMPSMPGAQPWGVSGSQNAPNLPPLYASPLSPLPTPGSSVAPQSAMPASPAWGGSPFANPVGANPFAAELEQSPFDQPYTVNPFGTDPAPPAPAPSYANAAPQQVNPAPAFSPFSAPPLASQPGSGERAMRTSQAGFASAPGYSNYPGQSGYADEDDDIQDAWIPPDADEGLDGQTGIVPEVAFQASSRPAPAREPIRARDNASFLHDAQQDTQQGARSSGGSRWLRQNPTEIADADMQRFSPGRQPRTAQASVSRQATAAQVPAIRIAPDPAEEALGAVLVEGALLTPSKLDALKGIQQMLAGVNVHVKLGDLALRFKFLSPDQLLAAVLVSRGMVSPQQIASLGRVKQELAATGMDHDLETLLLMFNILPIEILHELRAELAPSQGV